MIDESTVRRELAGYEARLAQMDGERNALQDMIKAHKAWLTTMTAPDHVSPEPPSFPPSRATPPATKVSVPVGEVSMRSAVVRVMRDAGGTALHTREVLVRAERLGARTNAKVPLSVVDLILLNLMKKGRTERTAPRTWRWTDMDRPGVAVSVASRPTD